MLSLMGTLVMLLALNRETLTYACWLKQGDGMKWADLPLYLRGRASKANWHVIARFRVGNHGLGLSCACVIRVP
jgi:hypothetical protein